MAPNPKVLQAFRAMRNIGIPEEKVKPVLKNLLKLYEKKWELIEEENYRALADAIFEAEETEAEENKKKLENTERQKVLEEEAQVYDEPERPLKRLRLRHQEGQSSTSFGNSSPGLGGSPRVEGAELPENTVAPQPNSENTRTESQPVSPQLITRNKGKQPVSPKSLALQERSDPSQVGAADRTQPDVTMRTEVNSVSSPRRLRDKGKEPILPQNAPKEKSIISERSSQGIRFKEPKVEPGVIRISKQKAPVTRALIKPKDEPVTDEVPIAVIHPEPLPNGDSSFGNGSTGEPHGADQEPLASQSKDGKDKSDSIPTSSSEPRTNCELANIPDESAANLEIASSPLGEVKISLSCNSANGRPDFHMPSLDAVVKAVEDKCLRSYKIIDPNFSVKKLMKDMCECFLELGTDSNNESQETINVTPTIDLLKNCAADAVGDSDMALRPMSEPINIQCDADGALPQIPRLPPPCNGMDGCIEPEKNSSGNDGETDMDMECIVQKDSSGNDGETDKEMENNGLDHTNSESLVVVQQLQLTPDNIKSAHDVAKGQERVTISLINEINSDSPQSFHYIPQNVVFQSACVNFSLARIRDDNCCPTCDGDCLLSPTPCACALETGGDFVYTLEGLVKEKFLDACVSMTRDPQKHSLFYCKECPLEISKNEEILEPCKGHLGRKFIKECWWKCGCSKQCGNRVVQRGINRNLQVFMTPGGKGWGLRSLEDLPKGAFICEYVGEVLTNTELYDRVSQSPKNEEHAYPVLLDADWASGVMKAEEALCLDATDFGNVARFINHRCFDSNLVEIPVEVETPDHHYYHLAFFTTRKVAALEELTWDYGIDFDDHDHPIKAFQCCCGSKFCRNIKRSSRSRSSARS